MRYPGNCLKGFHDEVFEQYFSICALYFMSVRNSRVTPAVVGELRSNADPVSRQRHSSEVKYAFIRKNEPFRSLLVFEKL